MNDKSRRVGAGIALAVAVAVGLTGCLGRGASTSTSGGSVDTLYVVETRDVSAGTAVSGTIHPSRLASLSVQAQGTVTAVNVAEGGSVRKGDVLVRVDDRGQQNQVAQAESRYRAAVASLGVTRLSGLSQTKAQLQSALTQAQAQQVSARINLRNFTDKDTSALQVANLQEQVANAQASLRSAQNNLKSLQDYDTSALQVAVADFSVQQAQLNLQMAQTRLAVLQSRDVTTAQLAQLQSQVSQAKIALDTAKLNSKEAAQIPTTSNDRLAILQEQVDQAQATLDLAQLNLKNASSDSKAARLIPVEALRYE